MKWNDNLAVDAQKDPQRNITFISPTNLGSVSFDLLPFFLKGSYYVIGFDFWTRSDPWTLGSEGEAHFGLSLKISKDPFKGGNRKILNNGK